MIDLDDLGDDFFFVACYEDLNENKLCVYIWKGSSVQLGTDESLEYIDQIKQKFFSDEQLPNVIMNEEVPYSESDEFMNLL